MSKQSPRSRSGLPRRGFLAGVASLGGAALGEGGGSLVPAKTAKPTSPAKKPLSPEESRLAQAFEVRMKAAGHARGLGAGVQSANRDEEELPRRIACYSKALPHNSQGLVDPKAYETFLRAMQTGKPEHFERIPLGGYMKLANPQAAWAFELIGPDS